MLRASANFGDLTRGVTISTRDARTDPPSSRLRVLVVDDYRDSADALAAFIEQVGPKVAIAYGGLHALEVAHRFAPHFVFLDINMPWMDGYAVARVLRETSPDQPLLVAHSGQGRQQDIEAAFAAGFDRHLVKPAEATAVFKLLQEGLDRL